MKLNKRLFKKELDTCIISARVSVELAKKLDETCYRRKMTRSELINVALENIVDE